MYCQFEFNKSKSPEAFCYCMFILTTCLKSFLLRCKRVGTFLDNVNIIKVKIVNHQRGFVVFHNRGFYLQGSFQISGSLKYNDKFLVYKIICNQCDQSIYEMRNVAFV